jgi:Protein of unknown function (DUF1150)
MNRQVLTENEFAHLGEGEIAYVRKIRSHPLSLALNSGLSSAQAASQLCFPMFAPRRCKAHTNTNYARCCSTKMAALLEIPR